MYYITLIFLLSLVSLADAQTVRINSEGKKIIEYSDGRWQYVDDANQNTLSGQLEKNQNSNTNFELESQLDARKIADRLSKKASRMGTFASGTTQNRMTIEKEIDDFKNSTKYNSIEENEILTRKLAIAKNKEKTAYQNAEKAQKDADFFQSLIPLTHKKRQKLLQKYEEKYGPLNLSKSKTYKPLNHQKNIPDNQSYHNKETTQTQYKSYQRKEDVMLNPPKYICQIETDKKDELTKQRIIKTKPELFFTYTRPELKAYYTNHPHTTANAYCTALTGGRYVLSLQVTIRSKTALQEYGGILSGANLFINTLNGESYTLINTLTDRGKYHPDNDLYIFTGTYLIAPRDIKGLKNSEIDNIRLVWAEGYDNYEIYYIDFLKNHLNCILDK